MSTLKKILSLLNPQEQRRAGWLLIMVLIMAFLDLAGVASIMPFITVATNPKIIETNSTLRWFYNYFGFTSNLSFLTSIGFSLFVIMLISLSFKSFTIYSQVRYIRMREFSIGRRLTEVYLSQPYSWILNRNSADLAKNVLSEVSLVIGGCLSPMIELITNSIVLIVMVSLLLFVEPQLTISIIAILGTAYGLLFGRVGSYLAKIGLERKVTNEKRFVALNEAFGAFKEVKFGRLENFYLDQFSKPSKALALLHASGTIVQQLPRFALEAFVFGGLTLMTIYLIRDSQEQSAIPIISLFALAGYRIMPALQGVYASLSHLRFSAPALDALASELKELTAKEDIDKDALGINLNNEIRLNDISYLYDGSKNYSLRNITLSIPANFTVGFVGTTGSGKTTVIDIILGLISPTNGSLEIDGHIINKSNCHLWQYVVGYVPQHIYLADDTIASNIAFGVEPDKIDMARVEQAAQTANLHEFVSIELQKRYETVVGERGVRLSGGQRQRIGIARALYHNPRVLVMDEATSALDNLTEKAVMDAVYNLGHRITVILVAHRINTVRKCDRIFLMNKGQIETQGTFEELLESSETFKQMAISEGQEDQSLNTIC